MTPKTSIVVVTWNSAASIVDCLTSIRDAQPSSPYEIVVVDNASHDHTVELARKAHPATVIVNENNRGLAAANNQGIAATEGRYLIISNPDVLFQPGTIDELIACAERHPRAAFVISKLRSPGGQLQTSVGDMPVLREALFGRRASRRAATGARSGIWWDGWSHDEELAVGHGMECCYLVRREALAEIGPQDERYRLDWEGFDWSRRAHEAGWEIWFAPDAEAVHLGGVSIRQALPRWIVSSHRGMYTYFAARTARPLRPLLALVLSARAVAKLLGLVLGDRLYTWGSEAH